MSQKRNEGVPQWKSKNKPLILTKEIIFYSYYLKLIFVYVLRILKLFGDNESTETISAVGSEQEYFLIKKEVFNKRKDLRLTGRTLFGKELIGKTTTHYMGSISYKTGKDMTGVEERMDFRNIGYNHMIDII